MEYAQRLHYQSLPAIQEALGFYKTPNLKTDAGHFRSRIEDYKVGRLDIPERYRDAANQNLHMVKFHWGHDHDFGAWQEPGLMGTRHLWMLSRMFDHFGVRNDAIAGKRILDVGSWTGGVSLALAQMGADVDAIDEINKYVSCLNFLSESFGMQGRLRAHHQSLYEMPSDWNNRFDTVCFFGVVYHLSDPIVGLRRLYNIMKPGGTLLLETMAIDTDRQVFEYEGPGKRNGQFGWNWFVPSPTALRQMLIDTGFKDVQVGNGLDGRVTQEGDPMGANRCFAVATKDPDHVICQAGLSVDID